MDVEQRVLDCTAPGFIKRYFATSRLHHLSTWKADLADYIICKMNLNNRPSEVTSHKASHPDEPFRTIMHVDMDCFFASVGVRDRPHLVGKPVAVAHSQGGVSLDYSTSEIASCTYEARAKGVKNGMFIGSAKELAPDLIIIPYEFEQYDACSKALYHTLLTFANYVQSVSVDEAYIDVTFRVQKKILELTRSKNISELLRTGDAKEVTEAHEDAAMSVANQVRAAVLERTQCNASVGIGSNILLARIATQMAKPNGAHSLLCTSTAQEHLKAMPIRSLPGVGRSLSEKCELLQLRTCGDVQCASQGQGGFLSRLRKEVGEKIGDNLHNFCWGADNRVLENKPRQTVGADINWGIRFANAVQVDAFLRDLSEEVYGRLGRSGHTAKQVTVDVKKKLYEGEPGKFLGCGHCLDLSKSIIPGRAIASADALYRCVSTLYKEIGLQPQDVRGIGIHLKKLQFGTTATSSSTSAAACGSASGASTSGSIAGYFGGLVKQNNSHSAQGPLSPSILQPAQKAEVMNVETNSTSSDSENEAHQILTTNRKSKSKLHGTAGASGLSVVAGTTTDVTTVPTVPVAESEPGFHYDTQSTSVSRLACTNQDSNAVPLKLDNQQHASYDLCVEQQSALITSEQQRGALAFESTPAITKSHPHSSVGPVGGSTRNMPVDLDDIDLDVFAALPEEIQRELQQEFAQRGSSAGVSSNTAVPSKPKRNLTTSNARQSTSSKRSKPSVNTERKPSDGKGQDNHNKQRTLDMWRVIK